MHSWLTRIVVGTVALASIAAGPAAIALASSHHHARSHALHVKRGTDPAGSESTGESAREASANEADADSSRQAAACQSAGVDPNGANVQYDDQTGTCSANGGGGAGDQTQQ
jgi:hypothetical protein